MSAGNYTVTMFMGSWAVYDSEGWLMWEWVGEGDDRTEVPLVRDTKEAAEQAAKELEEMK